MVVWREDQARSPGVRAPCTERVRAVHKARSHGSSDRGDPVHPISDNPYRGGFQDPS